MSAAAAAGGSVALPGFARRARPVGGRRAVRAVRRLPDAPLLDRLISGRFWIGIIAFCLIGVVFLQVSLLRLNAGIGRSVEREQTLERQNSTIRASLASLSSDQRVAQVAGGLGMFAPDADSIHYLDAGRGRDAVRAAAGIRPPAPGTMTASTSTTAAGSLAAFDAGAAGAGTTVAAATSTPATTATTAVAPPSQSQAGTGTTGAGAGATAPGTTGTGTTGAGQTTGTSGTGQTTGTGSTGAPGTGATGASAPAAGAGAATPAGGVVATGTTSTTAPGGAGR